MWIASKHGFYSIVHKGDGFFHIRGRHRDDLTRLRNLAGSYNNSRLPLVKKSHAGSDYPWRLILGAGDMMPVFMMLMESIDYPNFKAEIADTPHQQDKLPAYHEIWHVMSDWQRRKK